MNVPSRCSIVLVAGSALKEFPNIKLTVEHLSNQLKMVPHMMVFMMEDAKGVINTTIDLKPILKQKITDDGQHDTRGFQYNFRFPPMVR